MPGEKKEICDAPPQIAFIRQLQKFKLDPSLRPLRCRDRDQFDWSKVYPSDFEDELVALRDDDTDKDELGLNLIALIEAN